MEGLSQLQPVESICYLSKEISFLLANVNELQTSCIFLRAMPTFLVRGFQSIVVFCFGDYRAYFSLSQIWLHVRIIWGVLKTIDVQSVPLKTLIPQVRVNLGIWNLSFLLSRTSHISSLDSPPAWGPHLFQPSIRCRVLCQRPALASLNRRAQVVHRPTLEPGL